MARYDKKIKDDREHREWTSQRIRELQRLQSLPLPEKIAKTEWLIAEAVDWYGLSGVALSYSTGKDSSVLSHIARHLYPDMLHIFANTTCEYPESLQLYRRQCNEFNLIMARPKGGWNFKKVVNRYGYPMFGKDVARVNMDYRNAKNKRSKAKILKHMKKDKARYIKYLTTARLSDKCCDILKHGEIKKLEKRLGVKCSIMATMAGESQLRRFSWVDYGCNVFKKTKNPRSRPLSFWTEKDIWDYIDSYGVEVSELYRMGYKRNGCMFCGFGVHLEKKPNKIQRLAWTHPRAHDYLVRNFSEHFRACDIDISPTAEQVSFHDLMGARS